MFQPLRWDAWALSTRPDGVKVSDSTPDSQIACLKDSGADIFISWTTPKATAQAIGRVAELKWKHHREHVEHTEG
jgi:hypothetical protein